MSERWVSVTVADLQDTKVSALVDALRQRALGAGQTDPAPRVIQSVTTDIRRKIASCQANRVDADETKIPASLVPLATDIIIARLKGRLEIELTKFEEDQLGRHDRTLERIASCSDVIEQPDDSAPPPVQVTSGTPSMSNEGAQRRRDRRGGL